MPRRRRQQLTITRSVASLISLPRQQAAISIEAAIETRNSKPTTSVRGVLIYNRSHLRQKSAVVVELPWF